MPHWSILDQKDGIAIKTSVDFAIFNNTSCLAHWLVGNIFPKFFGEMRNIFQICFGICQSFTSMPFGFENSTSVFSNADDTQR